MDRITRITTLHSGSLAQRVGTKGTAAPDATLAERRSTAWAGNSNSNSNGMTGLAGWTGLNRGSVSRPTSLPQRAQCERNGRSGRHSSRDVLPHSLGPGDTLPDAETVILPILPILAILSKPFRSSLAGR